MGWSCVLLVVAALIYELLTVPDSRSRFPAQRWRWKKED